MEFGKTLREAREAKGYSVSQLAEITHIMSRTIEGLEAEDFSSIPAPIYGRGFVKLCCQHLDLEQQPMVEEFMAIYNGEKPAAKPAPVAEPPKPQPVEEPQPAPEIREEPVADAEPPPPPQNFGELFNQQPEPPPETQPVANAPTSRFAPPQPIDDGNGLLETLLSIPWRLVGLIIVAILILWALIAGCRSVYRVLSAPAEEPAAAEVSTPEPSNSTTELPRSPKPVKPLYID